MASVNGTDEITLDIIPDELQTIVFSNLEIIQLLRTINILSKKYYQMVNKGTLIWKLLSIKKLRIATYQAYEPDLQYDDPENRNIDKYITFNNRQFQNAPNHFLSKIKLIPLNLDQLRIRMVLKPWCEYKLHQDAMKFMNDLFENWLSIDSVQKISFSSYPNEVYNNGANIDYISQTKLYTKIMEICKPIKLDFDVAIIPNIISPICSDNIKKLTVCDTHQKYFDFNDFCQTLKMADKIEKIYIGNLMKYGVNKNVIESIPWPDTLKKIHWSYGNYADGLWKPFGDEFMPVFEQDVKSKCPNLQIFGPKRK